MTGAPTGTRRDRSLLELAAELAAKGEPFALATVVRVSKPTSAKVGDKAVLTERGVLAGWIGGSCAEPTVIEQARAALADGNARLVHLSPETTPPPDRDSIVFVPMTCFSGGAIEIYVEPHRSEPDLVVFGNSPVAAALTELAMALDYFVTLVDLSHRPPMPVTGDRLVTTRDAIEGVEFRSGDTYAVIASHGVFDDVALECAAAIEPAYIGLVASSRRAAAMRAQLERTGTAAGVLANLRSPAGLDIGAVRPEEVALSIMAEIVAVRRDHRAIGESRPPAAPDTADATSGGARTPARAVSTAARCCGGATSSR